MSDPRELTQIEQAIERAIAEGRISRRSFLRRAGRGGLWAGGALSLGAILAACGIKPAGSQTAASASVAPTPIPTQAGIANWANWPAYIDIDDKGKYPTIEKFQKETGIKVTYTEDINDNEEFFGKIQPDLAAGNPTSYDLIVMTDWMIEKMNRLGYLEQLDKSELPNFTANADPLYVDPWYDKGNKVSLAWQSGITGIGYNPKLTKREITTFDDLLDPAFKGHVGMFSEMRDTMCMALLSIGIIPEKATVADVQRAGDILKAKQQAGQFRNFYGNDYYDELANKNLWVTIAWSGDVTQMQLYDNADVKFVIPQSGGMRWVDNMAIPNKAAHPTDAHKLINFWYDPANAVTLSEYIGYFSPVKGIPDLIIKDADSAAASGDKATADQLRVVAATVNPTPAQLKNVYNYKILPEAEEKQWNDIFQQVTTG
ncbi:MAG: spermidine/putrescine ABC transporter substrate-binding protein [Chloroflexota bacterium]|nr:spermidine/putrescine ABC transporter substrate-binding protein [Chloroflexota bacterium]